MLSSIIFLLFLVSPAVGWTCYSRSWQGKLPAIVFFLLLCFVGYVLYVGGISLVSWAYQKDLSSYDLNGDGEFRATELTPEAKTAMQRFANDTGRSFAPIAAVPATLAWVSLNLVLALLLRWVYRKLRRRLPAPA